MIHDMMYDEPHHVAERMINADLKRLGANGVISVRAAVTVDAKVPRGKPGGLVQVFDSTRPGGYIDGAKLVDALQAAKPCADDYGAVSGLAGARRAVALLLGRNP